MRCKNVHTRSRQLGYLSHMTTDEGVLGCVVCLHVYLGVRGEVVEAISYGDQIFYIIWCDMIWWYRPTYGMGLCKKCDDRVSRRLDWALTSERGRETLCMWEREKGEERMIMGWEKWGGRGKNDRKSDALKENEDEENSHRELIWLGREEENGETCKDEWTVKKTKRNKSLFQDCL